MAIYFLHLIVAHQRIEDPEGAEFHNVADAKEVAITSARELMAERIKQGARLSNDTIEIADEQGNVLGRVRLRDLVQFEEDVPD